MQLAGQAQPPRRVLVAMGTRPEVIKLFPVVRALERLGTCEPVVCATGQHRELLDQTLEHFSLRPQVRLDVMRAGQSPAGIAGRLLQALTGVFDRVRPGYVVVQGDTTAALATGLAASYEGLPVAHVEAGLRTGDPAAPFPEETNRRLLAGLATLHFAPTPLALENLLVEGVSRESIHVTGNTVIDTLHWALERSGERRHRREHHSPERRRALRPHVLVTAHTA
jgi:UDP-N-acetylglucosamine 2-epimerase (non-hydrolysing)